MFLNIAYEDYFQGGFMRWEVVVGPSEPICLMLDVTCYLDADAWSNADYTKSLLMIMHFYLWLGWNGYFLICFHYLTGAWYGYKMYISHMCIPCSGFCYSKLPKDYGHGLTCVIFWMSKYPDFQITGNYWKY